jgi:hypothetical protein
MADNVSITPGSGATVAADDIGGVLFQRVKIAAGADGSATDVSSAAPLPVTLSSTEQAYLDGIETKLDTLHTDATAATPAGTNNIGHVGGTEYETVAASATDQALGATGATGDYLSGVLVVPATTSPGAVSIKDGAGSAITIFTGGATSVSNLVPFFVPVGAKSGAGAWKVTTGSNVSAIGVGDFT